MGNNHLVIVAKLIRLEDLRVHQYRRSPGIEG